VSTQAVIPMMRKKQYGRMVYISSGLAKSPAPNFIAQGTTKGALISFSKYIAQEFGFQGITANVISPGLVLTEATAYTSNDWKQYLASMTPLERLAEPEDVARAVLFFSSDDSRFMTGVYAPVSEGMEMN
jgi:3-oxoacyl-[acyl-carrier protein] reductase